MKHFVIMCEELLGRTHLLKKGVIIDKWVFYAFNQIHDQRMIIHTRMTMNIQPQGSKEKEERNA